MSPLKPDNPLTDLQQTLASDPDNFSNQFNLGLYLWDNGEKKRSVEHFVAAAKMNPSFGDPFRYLGKYYSSSDGGDLQKAIKCYQRAVILNYNDAEAGEALCGLLDASGKESLEIAVCKEASEKSPRAFWAFKILGYLMVGQKKWSEAVQSLQHAIRGYPICTDLWEALGLSYRCLGMFTAAIKSYGRAIELDESRIFPVLESGNILLMIGSFRKAIEQFRRALEIRPQNATGHFGLASALLGLSQECTNFGAFRWAATLLEEASEVVKAGTSLCGNVYSAWKLHGDIKSAYAKCFPWDACKEEKTAAGNFKLSIYEWKNTRLLAANKAKLFYQKALHLSPWHASLYSDVAIALSCIALLEAKTTELDDRQLPERMSTGSLVCEGTNSDSWVILGCLSKEISVKQHALIRGLQLDPSLSAAWAYLGKLYRELGENQMAIQAFNHARSIDPSLALPWAGMAANLYEKTSMTEAYESCLRAAQILPVAEFQIGLGKLAVLSGQLLSPQVQGAIDQAVQRAPYYPESHNLKGLMYESRLDFQSAIASYRLAQCALNLACSKKDSLESQHADLSINLSRALCKAGYAVDAAHECENLEKKNGNLDSDALQIYAVALWKLGKKDLALSIAKKLAKLVFSVKQRCAVAALGLICSLIYHVTGQKNATTFILKLPAEFLPSAKMSFIVAAINALNPSTQLQTLLQSNLCSIAFHDSVIELHYIICTGKMVHGSEQNLNIQSGADYLKKVLHMFPNSAFVRNHLSSLILSTGDWTASHKALKSTVTPSGYPTILGSKSSFEIYGIAGVACYDSCITNPKFSFATCKDNLIHGATGVRHLQKWLHCEPWNIEAQYMLALNVLQKAREEKYPPNLCATLKRLLSISLSKDTRSNHKLHNHLKFLTLLTASEVELQTGDFPGSISHASNALKIPSCSDPFFAHLQLCRAYATQDALEDVRNEYTNCLRVKTMNPIGWISLKYLELKFNLQKDSHATDSYFQRCFSAKQNSQNMWTAVFGLACCQGYMWDQDFRSAEQALAHACSSEETDSCLLLCHGAICMELVRQRAGSEFLSRAVNSLRKAQQLSPFPLPFVSLLLAQAEASLGQTANWERYLRFEYFSWPPEMRPAELFFQMHLLAKKSSGKPKSYKKEDVELSLSPESWILRAIHLNPSCLRYWKAVEKLLES